MDNGGSLTTGTLTASITQAATTTSKLYSTSTALASPSENGGNHGPTVSATTIVFLVLAFISVALRIIARGFIARRMRIDDYLILVAFALSFGMCLSIIQGVNYGFGRHSSAIPYAMALEKQKYQYAFTLLFNPAIAVTKVSILAFYLLVFKVQKHFRRFCWITMAVVISAGVALTLLLAFRCSPIGLVFDPESNRQPFEGCIGTVRIYFASAPVNILEDLAIIVLPIPVLTSLRLPTRQKAILLVVFSLGLFDIVVGIIRIHYFQLTESQALDFDYNAAYSFMWAAIEVNVGIVCASIPMTKPLVSRFFPGWLGSTSLSEGHRDVTQYDPTFYNNSPGTPLTPQMPLARRGTIGSTSHRPSIGVAWMSAYGDDHGAIGELGHVDGDGKIISPRGRRNAHPANRLEAALWEDNAIFIKTPPGTLHRIAERGREHRYGSLENGGSGSTAVAQPSEASSYLEHVPTTTKPQTPPWEKLELDEIDPLDSSGIVRSPTALTGPEEDIPPWEKLELPGLDDPNLMGFNEPFKSKSSSKSPGDSSATTYYEPKRKQSRKTSTSSTGSSSTRAPSGIFGIGRSRSKSRPEGLSLEIPNRYSGQIPQIFEPGSRKASQDTDISPTDKRRSIKTGPEPLLPPPPPGMDTPDGSTPHLPPPTVSSRHRSSSSSGEAPLGARKEQIDVAELANEKQIVEPPDETLTPIVDPQPWDNLHLEDLSNKAKPYNSTPSPEEKRSKPSATRTESTKSTSLLRDTLTREQYEKLGSIIDPSTPASGIVTPAWAKEENLRDDEGDTPPAVIGSSTGFARVGGTPVRERKLKDYFGEENIGAFMEIGPGRSVNRADEGDEDEDEDEEKKQKKW
ncbi:hypothetical protein TWF106_011718 [Orbilia oligospora]|uniref:Rhodopsin domain-containing protein n=2 Tax=Orbilia oligospora TaxID=2813651 RepID=A0A7C8QD72_ORBOL|nr:hypothetical protein TWF788_001155 [Orbilia oligospora]KAF3207536.1 hypothetical protein TWF679_008370 [Orbilia oligospora]KAF3207583.1 hypothetical protein TWF106_011718 [Orbilia oligospora]